MAVVGIKLVVLFVWPDVGLASRFLHALEFYAFGRVYAYLFVVWKDYGVFAGNGLSIDLYFRQHFPVSGSAFGKFGLGF